MTNERMPDFHSPSSSPSSSSPGRAFPTVQAPSTRARSPAGAGSRSIDDAELEAKFRKTLLDDSEEDESELDEAEVELRNLANRLARVRGGGGGREAGRPDALRRHGTV